MSTAAIATIKPPTPQPQSTSNTNNPFDTVFDDEESADEWWEDDTPDQNSDKAHKPDNRHSVQKPVRDQSTRRQLRQNVKAGIKVVTNLSRPQAKVPVQIPPPKSVPAPALATQQGRFVDYAALKALEGKAAHTKTGAFWKSRNDKDGIKAQEPAPVISEKDSRSSTSINVSTKNTHHLAPSPLDTTMDLSPSDRPIFIGLSIPSNETTDHTLSPQTAASEATKIVRSYEHRSPTAKTPETPTIIITPADGMTIWSALNQTNASSDPRARSASSVYSQAPNMNDRSYKFENAPPVPEMPSAAREEERQRLAGLKSYFSPDSDVGTMWEDESVATKSRVVSSCTIFEEDESPILFRNSRARSMSGASKSIRHPSISTIGQRQSTGWWNYITTPFMTRTNTFAARDLESHPVPAVPNLLIAVAKAKDAEGEAKSWEKQFSPVTPETSTTIASDRWWEDAKNNKAFEQTPVVRETRHKVETSTGTLPIIFPEYAGLSSGNTPSESDLRRGNTTSTFHTLNTAISPSDREIPMVFHSPPMTALDPSISSPQSQNIHIHIHSASAQAIQPMRAAVVEGNNPSTVPQGSLDETPPPPYSPSPTRLKKMRPVFPPGHALGIQYPGFQSSQSSQYPASPGPVSPGLQAAMTSQGAIPMSDVPLTPAATRRPINLNSGYPVLPERTAYVPFTAENVDSTAKKAKKAEAKRQRNEKEDAVARRVGGFWRGRGCFSDRGCYGRSGAEGRKRRRWYFGLIATFLSITIIAVVLATQLVRKSNTIEEPSQWLNLTGFPPIFTGLSTVAAPINTETDTSCVFPSTQWSCDLPKELHASVAPRKSNQPRFLMRIQWDNSTLANETFANVTGSTKSSITTRSQNGSPVSAGQFVKHMLLKARQAVTFIPTPNSPKFAEQFFLGNTTDRIISDQKAGESTPFYISFLPTDDVKEINERALAIRQKTDTSSGFPDLKSIIPAPSRDSDGTAAPANLLPFPTQQPIRLYDRGLETEHYSFYTYYDRSIFLKSVDSLNKTNLVNGEVPDDRNGGARESEAKFRCTWRETRFMVQMWTRMNATTRLLNSTRLGTQNIDTGSTPLNFTLAGQDFNQPGTFPYPTTITVDRHGGDPESKMLYCYKMNDRREQIVESAQIFDENRGFGGTLINGASFFGNKTDPSLGGFDGGTGGCACKWRNFEDVIRVQGS